MFLYLLFTFAAPCFGLVRRLPAFGLCFLGAWFWFWAAGGLVVLVAWIWLFAVCCEVAV